MEILKLKKPAMIDGEPKTEISYDLESLTGNDMDMALQECKRRGAQLSALAKPEYYEGMLRKYGFQPVFPWQYGFTTKMIIL